LVSSPSTAFPELADLVGGELQSVVPARNLSLVDLSPATLPRLADSKGDGDLLLESRGDRVGRTASGF
jgi:hypothetical protein